MLNESCSSQLTYGFSMNVPKKITPCPIVEAVIEIRFDSKVPGDAVFGVIYNKVKEKFSAFEKLPILQIPEAIRSTDPVLIYSPHYKLRSGDFILQIGPKVVSFANVDKYCGWEIFYKEIKCMFDKVYALGIVEKVTRLGLRYINVFSEMNIFERSDLKVVLKEKQLLEYVSLNIKLPCNGFLNTLIMASGAQLLSSANKVMKGSVIDIDTELTDVKVDFYDKMDEIINNAHIEEKKLFFSILKEEYIKTLNPEY